MKRRMTTTLYCVATLIIVCSACLAFAPTPTRAPAEAGLRTATTYAIPGVEPVDLALYRIATYGNIAYVAALAQGDDVPLGGIDLVMAWDPTALRLINLTDRWLGRMHVRETRIKLPYEWLLAGFLDDSNLGGRNVDLDDGDVWFTAWPNFAASPIATRDPGLPIAIFEFEILRPGDHAITLDAVGDKYAGTRAYHAEIGGYPLPGSVTGCVITVQK